LSGGLVELGSRHLALLLAILLEALSSFLGRVDVVVPRLHPNALDLGLRDVGLVLREIVRPERVLVAAVVAHDLVGQWVEVAPTWKLFARAPMPVPGHPSIAALDASGLRVDVREVLVEA